jgi:FdhD protein
MIDSVKLIIKTWNLTSKNEEEEELIAEEPLSIRVQGKPYAVVMRTPGDEIAHVAGFSLAEGIVDSPEDLNDIAFCDGEDTNVVAVTLKAPRQEQIAEIMDRREFVSQTSCGLCGKEIVKDLFQSIRPISDGAHIDIHQAYNCLETLSESQPLRSRTRAAHAAALYSSDGEQLAVAEDVGRHNALDKAVGRLFLNRTLTQASLLVLSSRISYELVQKAARARIPVILAVSRPTSLAVQLAAKLNITLACRAKKEPGLYIFCGEERLVGSGIGPHK